MNRINGLTAMSLGDSDSGQTPLKMRKPCPDCKCLQTKDLRDGQKIITKLLSNCKLLKTNHLTHGQANLDTYIYE